MTWGALVDKWAEYFPNEHDFMIQGDFYTCINCGTCVYWSKSLWNDEHKWCTCPEPWEE